MLFTCYLKRLWIENERKVEGNFLGKLTENLFCFAVALTQIFVAQMTFKLMYICFIWCVESFYQKSFELIEQNLNFRNEKKSGKCVQGIRTVSL